MDIPATEPERDDFICRMIEESLFEDLTCRKNASKEEGRIRTEIKTKIKSFLDLPDWIAVSLNGKYTSNIQNMKEVLNNENNVDLIIASLKMCIRDSATPCKKAPSK